MRKIKNTLAIVAAAATLASCSFTYPGYVTANPVGSKVGEASRKVFLGLAFGTTDLSIEKAAKNGGITKVATVDYKVTGSLFSTTYTTIVSGE